MRKLNKNTPTCIGGGGGGFALIDRFANN